MKKDLQSDAMTKPNVPLRHHSRELAATIQSMEKSLGGIDMTDLSAFRKLSFEPIKTASAEASFLGFPQTVQLCRTLLTVMQKQPTMTTSLSEAQSIMLKQGLMAIQQLVTNGQVENATNLGDITRELKTAFLLTEEELSAFIHLEMSALASDLHSGLEEKDTDTEHRDLDVYRSSRLDSLDQCLEEESWIVSQLASLAEDLSSGTHSGHPAARLMHVLKNHKFFNQVDRVCLVGRVAGGNQLVVIDASLSDRCPENSLKKGYSCFVNPDGSLFKMRPGTVRIFGDCERVLASFAAQGKPAQRSIALISDQGLRSGLCLAIGRGTEIQGFLFLNSVQEDLFREITVKSAPLLSLFGLIATIGLDTSGFHPSMKGNLRRNDTIPKSSTLFTPEHFKSLVESALSHWHRPGVKQPLTIVPKGDNVPFLYLPTTIVYTTAELIYRIQDAEKPVAIEVAVSGGVSQVSFCHLGSSEDGATWEWLNRIVKTADSEFLNKPVSVRLTDTHVVISFPFEPLLSGHQELLYSTVY
jgi:hypothetical protein